MSAELSKQLFTQPKVLKTTGFVLLAMMLIPAFPWPTLLLLGALFLLLGYRLSGGTKKEAAAETPGKEVPNAQTELDMLRNPDNIYQMLEVEPIEMEFGYTLIPLVDESQGGSFADKIVLFRRQFALETGIVVPSVRMRDNFQLNNNEYVIKIRGEEIARGELLTDHLLIMNSGEGKIEMEGVDTKEPAFGLPAKWISRNQREEAEMAGYTVIEPASVMMTHLGEIIRRHAGELLGRREINLMLDTVKKNNQSLVDEVIPGKISIGDLQKILQNLLREEIPIRDLVTILETVSEHAAKIKDIDILTEYVRQSLKRTITRKIAPGGEIKVLTVDPQVEKMISSSVRQTEHGAYLALEPDRAQGIIRNLSKEMEKASGLGFTPVVVVSPVVRLYFKRLTEQMMPDLAVISYNELENNVRVQAIGTVVA